MIPSFSMLWYLMLYKLLTYSYSSRFCTPK